MVSAMNVSYKIQPYNFELYDLRPFLQDNWSMSYFIVLTYLLLIFVGQNYMKERKSFNLQGPLILWSFCLAVFSILGAVRTWGFMGAVILSGGLKQTVCFTNHIENAIVKFWACAFLLSKIVELGDTAFIILRKRPLIFVHWYHHSTVLLFVTLGYKNKLPSGGWFMTMNFGVHSIMYTYYTMKAAKIKYPRLLPMVITSLQILQMFMGPIIGTLAFIWRQEQGCYTSVEEFSLSLVLYVTYFILFVHFFHQTYIRPKVKTKTKSQ